MSDHVTPPPIDSPGLSPSYEPETPTRDSSEFFTPRPGLGGAPPARMPAGPVSAVARDLKLAELIYERCFSSIARGIPCDGNFGTFTAKKCWRCRKGKRECLILHECLIPYANRHFRARDAAARLDLDASATDDQKAAAATELQEANQECKTMIKLFHTNRNKAIGKTRTPRGRRTTAAPTGSGSTTDVMALEEMQKIRGLMEEGVGMLGSVLANGLHGNHRTVLDKIASKRAALWEEEEVEEEVEEEENEDDMDL